MGTDFSDLSPKGEEAYVDLLKPKIIGDPVEPDRGDDTIFGHWAIDGIFSILNSIYWWVPISLIFYWLIFP